MTVSTTKISGAVACRRKIFRLLRNLEYLILEHFRSGMMDEEIKQRIVEVKEQAVEQLRILAKTDREGALSLADRWESIVQLFVTPETAFPSEVRSLEEQESDSEFIKDWLKEEGDLYVESIIETGALAAALRFNDNEEIKLAIAEYHSIKSEFEQSLSDIIETATDMLDRLREY